MESSSTKEANSKNLLGLYLPSIEVGSLANERELLDQKNRELSTEVMFLKSQLNEYNAKLAHLKDEMEKNGSVLQRYKTKKIDMQCELKESKERIQNLLAKTATMENKMNSLELLVNEGGKQRLDLIVQHKVTEHPLRQRNEILQEEVDKIGRLLDEQNQRVEELETALHSLDNDHENGKPELIGTLNSRTGGMNWWPFSIPKAHDNDSSSKAQRTR